MAKVKIQTEENVYLAAVRRNLPRLLSLYNTDSTSRYYGVGDRQYWGWKTIDFANATFQGACHGLARLYKHDALPDFLSKERCLELIDAQIMAVKTVMRADGSLEEAFPYEGSFCVTALVAYDVLAALELLNGVLTEEKKQSCLEIVSPLIGYVKIAEETHGFISNHLATSVAALFLWDRLYGDSVAVKRGQEILERILAQQSDEGWFSEYGGADPGYQTWATVYLAEIYRLAPSDRLKETLDKSLAFLRYFAHPDGSFGGIYGHRQTGLYLPGGIEAFARENDDAAALAKFMRGSIAEYRTVTLDAIDTPNLIPYFNAYCMAATSCVPLQPQSKLPAEDSDNPFIVKFDRAGLVVANHKNHYTIISTLKGGAFYSYDRSANASHMNASPLYERDNGSFYSTQGNERRDSVVVKLEREHLSIECPLYAIKRPQPNPYTFTVLRMMNVSIMRFRAVREAVKSLLVKMLLKSDKAETARNLRTISLGAQFDFEDQLLNDENISLRYADHRKFFATHMASQGYWQSQDTL